MPLHGTTTDWSQARDLSAEHPDKLHELQHLWLIEAFGGMGRLSESSVVNIKNKSHAVIAEVVVPSSGAEGVIVAQGDSIGGWSRDQVRMEFAYDGGVEGGPWSRRTTGPAGTSSPARSTGSRSTSTRPPRTSTT
jgi:arylsulfatase